MAILTLQQLQEQNPNMQPKRVVSLKTAQMEAETRAKTEGNQFNQETGGILGFGKKAFDTIFGGVKLAEGAGKALASGYVQGTLSESEKSLSDTEMQLIKKIQEFKKAGTDTTKLEATLRQLQEDKKVTADVQQDFAESLPTNKEVIGSSIRLGAAALAPTLGKTMAGATGATTAVGAGQGALRGALAGAGTGAIEGGIIGAGTGLEQNKDLGGVAMSSLGGAAIGGVTGGVLGGALGSISGAIKTKTDPNTILQNVTPNAKDLTPTQYKKLLAQGKITPKTATQPAQYVMGDTEKQVALKYSDVIAKDPVKTVININDKISSLDDEVGTFLKKNNGIFNSGELSNKLSASLDDVTDITIDSSRLANEKAKLVTNFVDGLEKNDMESLWKARKAFDSKIESAFKGSPTLQKELKIAFRNAVQDFVADGTPDEVYKGYMKDMSNLFKLRDTVAVKATKERASSAIQTWIKSNPVKSKVVGWGALLGTGFLAGKVGIGSQKED